MGLLSWLGLDRVSGLLDRGSSLEPVRRIASPFAGPSHLLPALVADDLFGIELRQVSRREALTVPAVKKARDLICMTLSRQPLVQYREGVPVPEQPSWLTRTDGQIGPRMRAVLTLDDCLFYGWSLWAAKRGADGFPLDASRVPPERWRFDERGNVELANAAGEWRAASAEEVILIPGPSTDGLLETAGRSIRAYRKLEDAWQARVNVPLPSTEIRYVGDDTIDEDEMKDVRDTYVRARQDVNGAVVVLPPGWEIHDHAAEGFNLFETGRNAAVLDVARHTNVPATLLDAANVNASSVTYSSTLTARSWFIDTTIRSWALPFEERLSQDDVVPRGTYVAFDLSELTELPDDGTGPEMKD